MVWNERNRTTKNNQRPSSLEGHDRRRLEQTRHPEEGDTSKMDVFERWQTCLAGTFTRATSATCGCATKRMGGGSATRQSPTISRVIR